MQRAGFHTMRRTVSDCRTSTTGQQPTIHHPRAALDRVLSFITSSHVARHYPECVELICEARAGYEEFARVQTAKALAWEASYYDLAGKHNDLQVRSARCQQDTFNRLDIAKGQLLEEKDKAVLMKRAHEVELSEQKAKAEAAAAAAADNETSLICSNLVKGALRKAVHNAELAARQEELRASLSAEHNHKLAAKDELLAQADAHRQQEVAAREESHQEETAALKASHQEEVAAMAQRLQSEQERAAAAERERDAAAAKLNAAVKENSALAAQLHAAQAALAALAAEKSSKSDAATSTEAAPLAPVKTSPTSKASEAGSSAAVSPRTPVLLVAAGGAGGAAGASAAHAASQAATKALAGMRRTSSGSGSSASTGGHLSPLGAHNQRLQPLPSTPTGPGSRRGTYQHHNDTYHHHNGNNNGNDNRRRAGTGGRPRRTYSKESVAAYTFTNSHNQGYGYDASHVARDTYRRRNSNNSHGGAKSGGHNNSAPYHRISSTSSGGGGYPSGRQSSNAGYYNAPHAFNHSSARVSCSVPYTCGDSW